VCHPGLSLNLRPTSIVSPVLISSDSAIRDKLDSPASKKDSAVIELESKLKNNKKRLTLR